MQLKNTLFATRIMFARASVFILLSMPPAHVLADSTTTGTTAPTSPVSGSFTTTDNTPCGQRKNNAMNRHSTTAATLYNTTVTNPNPLTMQNCVGALSTLGSLNFPSLSQIVTQLKNMACQAIKSEVSQIIGGMQYSFQLGPFGGVQVGLQQNGSVGAGSTTTSAGGVPITVNPVQTTSTPVSIPSTVSGAMSMIK